MRSDSIGLQDRMAGISLQHRRAELDAHRPSAGLDHGDEGITRHRTWEPQAGEPVLLCLAGLLDDPLDAGGTPAQAEPHAGMLPSATSAGGVAPPS